MARYLLGIDNGLTVSKAALFDLQGREVAVEGYKVDLIYGQPGWVERDTDLVWRTTAQAIRAVVARSGVDPRDIVAVGNSAHGNGLYLLDRHGEPLGCSITSMDNRAADIIAEWYQPGGAHAANFATIKQNTWAAQPAALLAWFKRHAPDTYAQIGHALTCKDYIKFRLTGEFTGDLTDASGTSLFDPDRGCWGREVLENYGIADILPALAAPVPSASVAGHVTVEAAAQTGLAAGTPVVGGLFDIAASAVGAGVIDEGLACIIAGTWSINEVVTRAPVLDKRVFMCNLYAVPGTWLVSDCSATSATNLEWFVNNLGAEERAEAKARGISVYEVCNERVAALPPGSVDVIFHPFLFGSNVQGNARAGFYGMGAWHTRAHLLRALYEGVVYGHLDHVNRLREAGARIGAARLTGGGSRSLVWTQMFADALQLPVEIPAGVEVAARGAAIAAGVGQGIYSSYEDAVAKCVRVERRHLPDPEATAKYLARFAEYKILLAAMAESWDRLAALQS